MKLLQKILLINWHYIRHELIELKQINFLTGKNGAGKSTIIDALQVMMLGDTSGYFFNKAANDRSNRTLKGYLRGEIAEDRDTSTVYLRGDDDFSSYIVLEFKDTVELTSFSLGVVFDSYRDGDFKHRFFYLKEAIPCHNFYQDGVPMNIKSLKAYFYNNYPQKYQFFENNRDYREVMAGVLGHLNEKFFRMFRKAVPFSPIVDIKGFITEFICDTENVVDITYMQENIRQYKQLEEELGLVEKRILALEKIRDRYQTFKEEKERHLVQSYLLDRAAAEKSRRELAKLQQEIKGLEVNIIQLKEYIDCQEKNLEDLQARRDIIIQERAQSDIYKKQQELIGEKDRLNRELEEISNSENRLSQILEGHWRGWRELIFWCEENIAGEEKAIIPCREEMMPQLEMLDIAARQSYGVLEHDKLQHLKTALDRYSEGLNKIYWQFNQLQGEYAELITKIKAEIEGLKQGIKPYPASLMELRQEISEGLNDKYQKEIKVQVFADLLEIRDSRWQNAIEAYLHTQKFYLIVEPQYFVEALQVYDRLKFSRNFYDIGLVDIERVMQQSVQVFPGSLAEEVETADPLARAYADFLLGKVIKCEKADELRQFRTAITPTCMLYHNFVACQLNPRRYEHPYIGQKSIAELIERKQAELAGKQNLLDNLSPRVKVLGRLKNTPLLTDNDINTLLTLKARAAAKEQVKDRLQQVIAELGSLDLSYLVRLEEDLKKCEGEISKTKEQLRQDREEHIKALEKKKYMEESLPLLEKELHERTRQLEEEYNSQWRTSIAEPRFIQELAKRKEAVNIITAFIPVVKGTETRMREKWESLINLRMDYNRDFKGSFNVMNEENDAFEAELKRLKDTLLLEYREKIKAAKERAQVQFQEDFISKLRANIENVTEQIKELNKAIKDTFFGRDKYKFTVTPNPHYRRFYDMITDDMLMEGFNLFSSAFQEKHRDTVEELFRQIVDIGEGVLTADQRQQLAENLERFTDYRTYLDFDLVNVDDEGRESRLSRVITKKSGGETQTPFYIAVLASFLQLYRVQQEDAGTIRLVVFDEAYSKMDHQRIQESIKLIRELGLQVILSAPTEKIGDIAPLVDRNLCVTRLKRETIVKAFDPRELMEIGA